MTVAEALRRYLRTCPLLADSRLNLDWLPEEAGSLSLEVTPSPPIVKRYLDGGTLRQLSFALSLRAAYSEELEERQRGLAFQERFAAWAEEQSRTRSLPELGQGRRAVRLEIVTAGRLHTPGVNTARYRIEGRLLYEQDAGYNEKET